LPAETQAAAAVFQIRLTELGKADLTVCTPLQVAILRTLAVHEWRRIILKVPALPDFVMPPQWLVLDSKRSIVDVLARLPKPKADDLSTT
jgi:hypothetical protein